MKTESIVEDMLSAAEALNDLRSRLANWGDVMRGRPRLGPVRCGSAEGGYVSTDVWSGSTGRPVLDHLDAETVERAVCQCDDEVRTHLIRRYIERRDVAGCMAGRDAFVRRYRTRNARYADTRAAAFELADRAAHIAVGWKLRAIDAGGKSVYCAPDTPACATQ